MRRWTAMMCAVLLLLLLSGCQHDTGSSGRETVTLKVWGAQEDQALLQKMIDSFRAANPDKTYRITLGVVGENDAKTRVLDDPAAAADLFSFASDQIVDLQKAGALYEITRNKSAIQNANSAGSVEAATVEDKL